MISAKNINGYFLKRKQKTAEKTVFLSFLTGKAGEHFFPKAANI